MAMTSKQIFQDDMARAKKEFEEERDRTLKSIPKSYKSMFGQIGFVKWGKVDYPVLILNPYNISPGPVRNQWLSMYKKLLKQGQLEGMAYLIYWYGPTRLSDFYSFKPLSEFTPFRVEAKKPDGGKTKPPSKIREKVKKGIALNAKEYEVLKRYSEMEEDLKKKPIDRRRGDINFQEVYENLTLKNAVHTMNGESPPLKRKNEEEHLKKTKLFDNIRRQTKIGMKQFGILDLINQWEESISSKTVYDELWTNLLDAVAQFSSELFLHYNLWNLFKASVGMMEELKLADLESFQDFRSAFEKVYHDTTGIKVDQE